MDRRVVTVATLVVLAIAGIATAAPGLGSLVSPGEETPAAPSGSASNGESASSGGTEPFRFELLGVEECGTTCRDVTILLYNQLDESATGVAVTARLYAGNGTDGDVLWTNEREVGTIEAEGSTTSTERVSLGPFEAAKLEASDGWVTVVLTVESDGPTVELTRRMNVR